MKSTVDYNEIVKKIMQEMPEGERFTIELGNDSSFDTERIFAHKEEGAAMMETPLTKELRSGNASAESCKVAADLIDQFEELINSPDLLVKELMTFHPKGAVLRICSNEKLFGDDNNIWKFDQEEPKKHRFNQDYLKLRKKW
jgi:hypothetical protein